MAEKTSDKKSPGKVSPAFFFRQSVSIFLLLSHERHNDPKY
jgi:hypothetical protein